METGDLVMFRGMGLFAWLIRTWTKSAWDHCGVLWICEGVPMVMESRFFGGVSCHALEHRMEDIPTIYPTGRAVDVAEALRHLGENYSIKDALRAGFGEQGDHIGWECAEFAAHLYGLPSARGWTPQGVVEALAEPNTLDPKG